MRELTYGLFDSLSLAERREDIAPNLDYELERFEQESGRAVRFNKESLRTFLAFAESPATQWHGNFQRSQCCCNPYGDFGGPRENQGY